MGEWCEEGTLAVEKSRLSWLNRRYPRSLAPRPTFAVLDECTSAVSADGEAKLYQVITGDCAVRSSSSRVGERAACLDRCRRSALIPAPFLSP